MIDEWNEMAFVSLLTERELRATGLAALIWDQRSPLEKKTVKRKLGDAV